MKRELRWALVLLAACGEDSRGSPPATHLDASVNVDSGMTSRMDGAVAADARAEQDARVCTPANIALNVVPTDVLLVQDQSLSMLSARWQPTVQTLETLTAQYQNVMSFGLSLFPRSSGVCDPGMLDVPLALGSAAQIKAKLDATMPYGVTPTGQTLKAALGFLGNRNQPNRPPAYVVLATDGVPDCPDGDMPDPVQGAVDAVTALKLANIDTYTIGYQLDSDGKLLMDRMASAGGTSQGREVQTADDLNAALNGILEGLVPCTYELANLADPAGTLLITLDAQAVMEDGSNGYVLEGTKITLNGSACSTLRDGRQHIVHAASACR